MSNFETSDDAAKAELLDLLLQATQDGIVDWNLQTGETTYNARWKHLLGFDSADRVEYHETPDGWRQLIHPDDLGTALRLIDDHLHQGWPLYTTLRMRHRHASYKHILVRGAAQRDQHDKALRLLLVFSDIDERIRDERRRRAELVQSHKLGAMGQLAVGVADEFEAELQLLAENLSLAKTGIDDLLGVELGPSSACHDLPSAIERSRTCVERAAKVARAMKAFAAEDDHEPRPADLKALIENTVVVATSHWRDVAEVELRISPDLPAVPCMRGELSRVLLNLILNAAQAIADVVGSSGAKGKISISAEADATEAVIRVADNGTGIAEHARSKVFEPFFTTKEAATGTGHGLSMAYHRIVERHQGSIHFETELGVGTTFIIRLPLRTATSEPSEPTP
jgi:two-component system, NtrC family, sensor kinase